ncbi:alpha-L-fucosidase [Pedobacter sp. UYEF25]
MASRILKLLFLIFFSCNAFGQKASISEEKMQWFSDAKVGIFIHWGIYSVNGISESWAFYNNYINHDNYMKQLEGFAAEKYNPKEWVNLIKESGAKYAVITTKHHDGVSLWNTKAPKATTTINNSAAKRDLISPFVAELKKAGLKTGLYFSLPDWSYPDYDVFTRDRKRYDANADVNRWKRFLTYYQGQVKELSTQYNPDLIWFDGNWEHSAAQWETGKVRDLLKARNKNIIINSRLDQHGDYETPEQGVPVLRPNDHYWELCYTMNDSWGYQPNDHHYKTSNMIVRTLVDCIGMGGNLLLDIGPKPNGTIAPEQVAILKDLGRWTKKHAEAIYGTEAGIPEGHTFARSALSKDKKTLFLYLENKDLDGTRLSGIKSKIKHISVVGENTNATFTSLGQNDYLIKIPETAFDKDVTVLKVSFDDALQLAPLNSKPISYESLFIKNKNLQSAHLKFKKLSEDLNNGLNIFKDSKLASDGLGFAPDVKPLDEEAVNWVIKNAEVLSGSIKGIPAGHYFGNTALSADKQTLYLFVEGKPNGPIAIKGLKNNISRIRIVGEGTMLSHEVYNKLYWSKVPGIVYIPIPEEKLDKHLTIVAVLLDGPIDLYSEKVGAVENNL